MVHDAVQLKTVGKLNTEFIVDHLYEKYNDEQPVFGEIKLEEQEVNALKNVGYEEEFISKMQGHPQNATVGTAAVWLGEDREIVGAAMLRIFFPRRSYFTKLSILPWSNLPYSSEKSKKDEDDEFDIFEAVRKFYFPGRTMKNIWHNLSLNEEHAWIRRFDINLGVTTQLSKTNNDDDENKDEDKPYFYLLGFTYEINPGALLNVGAALPHKPETTSDEQFYIGFTLDSNILKQFGIIAK